MRTAPDTTPLRGPDAAPLASHGLSTITALREPTAAMGAPSPAARVLASAQPAFRILSVEKPDLTERSLESALAGFTAREKAPGADGRLLILRPAAFDTISAHIGWGENTDFNQDEQGGLLLGLPHVDPRRGLHYAVVERALPAHSAQGSSVYLSMDETVWRALMEEAERECPHLRIVGWYHTHPGTLRVFMSSVDRATQSRVFCEPWHFALVLNPQRCEWSVFAGPQAAQCVGVR